MLRAKLDRLNAILGKYPLPIKLHRDLLIMAAFDRISISAANTYEVVIGNEFAKIAVTECNPDGCHSVHTLIRIKNK
jgi:hypothetical protein